MTFMKLGAASALALGVLAGGAFAQEAVKIGIPVGLSGANSVVAPSVVQSAELAAEEINAAGGILGRPIELVVADDGSGAQGAQRAFDSLVFQSEVDVLISMETSAARNAGLPIVNRSGVPTSTPRSTRAAPAARGCTSTPGFPSSRLRRSSIISWQNTTRRPSS